MKKIFLGSVLGLIMLAPLGVSAQTVSVDLTTQAKAELVTAITAQIEQLLIQMIGALQQQIQDLLVKQGQQISQVQSSVDTINTNTTPAPVSVSSSGSTNIASVPAPELSVSTSGNFDNANYHGLNPTLRFTSYEVTGRGRDFTNAYILATISNLPGASLHITTDNPDGFLPDPNSQNIDWSTDYVVPAAGTGLTLHLVREGTWHYTISVVSHPEIPAQMVTITAVEIQ